MEILGLMRVESCGAGSELPARLVLDLYRTVLLTLDAETPGKFRDWTTIRRDRSGPFRRRKTGPARRGPTPSSSAAPLAGRLLDQLYLLPHRAAAADEQLGLADYGSRHERGRRAGRLAGVVVVDIAAVGAMVV